MLAAWQRVSRSARRKAEWGSKPVLSCHVILRLGWQWVGAFRARRTAGRGRLCIPLLLHHPANFYACLETTACLVHWLPMEIDTVGRHTFGGSRCARDCGWFSRSQSVLPWWGVRIAFAKYVFGRQWLFGSEGDLWLAIRAKTIECRDRRQFRTAPFLLQSCTWFLRVVPDNFSFPGLGPVPI